MRRATLLGKRLFVVLYGEKLLSGDSRFNPSRRRFVQAASFSAADLFFSGSFRNADASTLDLPSGHFIRLDQGWEFHQGPNSDPGGAWQTSEDAWRPVILPHCVNALDACDPDRGYYRGEGCYRARIRVANPFRG